MTHTQYIHYTYMKKLIISARIENFLLCMCSILIAASCTLAQDRSLCSRLSCAALHTPLLPNNLQCKQQGWCGSGPQTLLACVLRCRVYFTKADNCPLPPQTTVLCAASQGEGSPDMYITATQECSIQYNIYGKEAEYGAST